ncbi:MAG TPA: alpha/beta hydrolase-fold protein [Anaerolineales bacterium]|nr:alpha/beta hydrolase-fold protein [Anaerolineales bacterium]
MRFRPFAALALLCGLCACLPSNQGSPSDQVTPTLSAIPSSTITSTPTRIPPSPTATPLTCLSQPPQVVSAEIDTTKPPQLFLVYLPPCYGTNADQRYPVLYLLHGQTYMDDQWVRLGAPQAANQLILSGQTPPFIIVFPDDRYWNLSAIEDGFGDRIVNLIIPYIDSNYRTLADRRDRAVGGLSLGGGWAARLGLTYYNLFGAVGLNSPAIRDEDGPYIESWIKAVPADSWPRIWIDAGDQDKGLDSILQFKDLLDYYQVPYEFHRYLGGHSEQYWSAHVTEYLQWYAEGWKSSP